jgi:hypothetical protein
MVGGAGGNEPKVNDTDAPEVDGHGYVWFRPYQPGLSRHIQSYII